MLGRVPRIAMTIPQAYALALQHHQAGRLKDAEALYHQIQAVDAGHSETLHLLGVVVRVGCSLTCEALDRIQPNSARFPSGAIN